MPKKMKLSDVAWMSEAACKDKPTEFFFEHTNMNAAIKLCNRCDVRKLCLQWRLDTVEPHEDDYGVWGGTRPSERFRMRNRR